MYKRQALGNTSQVNLTNIYALVDSQVFYLYNLEIYAGLQPEGVYRISTNHQMLYLDFANLFMDQAEI